MTRREEKQLYENYMERLQRIREFKQVNPNETKAQQRERIQKAKTDYAYFVNTYFPHLATKPMSWFHKKAAKLVMKHPQIALVLIWFRGAAKSTHTGIFIPLWLWINEELHVMLQISSTSYQARRLLNDLQAEFEMNDLLRHDYGNQVTHGNWSDGEFVTRNGCAFYARGRGEKLRGLRYGRWRVNYVSIDDIDDDEMVLNFRRVRTTVEWVLSAVMNTGDPECFRVVVSNNLIHPKSVTALLAAMKEWLVMQVNILDKDGQPTWPELWPMKAIRTLESKIGYIPFQKERMNNPIIEGSVFKIEQVQYKRMEKLNSYDAIVGYWDESYTANDNSDFNAVVVVGRKGNEEHVLASYCRQSQLTEAVRWMYDTDELYKQQGALISWYRERLPVEEPVQLALQTVGEERGYWLTMIIDDKPKGNKFQRIVNMAFFFQRGSIYFNQAHKDGYALQTGIAQLLAIEEGYKGHDDWPDALQGALDKLNRMTRASKGQIRLGQRPRPNKFIA